MKNKKLTYFLIFVVALVWGLIIYRIFAAASGDDDIIPVTSGKPAKEVYNDFSIPKDTTKLLLNYRDPFGLVPFKDTTKMIPVHQHTIALSKPVPAINWSFIQYSGYIRNPTSKKLIALVIINGKNEMLSEGDTKEQVKLLKNLRDSIKISFNGKTKYIVIKSAAL
jgi:hypothetical protein